METGELQRASEREGIAESESEAESEREDPAPFQRKFPDDVFERKVTMETAITVSMSGANHKASGAKWYAEAINVSDCATVIFRPRSARLRIRALIQSLIMQPVPGKRWTFAHTSAIISISTSTSLGSRATSTVVRAGGATPLARNRPHRPRSWRQNRSCPSGIRSP